MSLFANCSGFNETQIAILAGLRGGTSAIAVIATIVLLVVTIVRRAGLGKDKMFKVYLFTLFGVSISYLTVLSLSVVHHLLPDPSAGIWCASFGFLHQNLSVIQITLLFTATYPIVACLLSGGPKENISGKKKCVLRGFTRIVIVLAALMVTFSFVPFLTGTYGEVGGWCWIISIDEHCEVLVVGLMEQIFLWIIYHTLISLICILMVVTAVILLLRACFFKIRHFHRVKDKHHDYKHISIKYIFQLFILVPILFYSGDIVLVAHINHYSFTKWVLYAIAVPISVLVIPLSFLLYIKFGNAGSEDIQAHTRANPSVNGLQSIEDLNQPCEVLVTPVARGHTTHSAADLRAGIQRECLSCTVISSKHISPSSVYMSAEYNTPWTKGQDTRQQERQNLLGAGKNRVYLIQ